jgi:hypothetical protein
MPKRWEKEAKAHSLPGKSLDESPPQKSPVQQNNLPPRTKQMFGIFRAPVCHSFGEKTKGPLLPTTQRVFTTKEAFCVPLGFALSNLLSTLLLYVSNLGREEVVQGTGVHLFAGVLFGGTNEPYAKTSTLQ